MKTLYILLLSLLAPFLSVAEPFTKDLPPAGHIASAAGTYLTTDPQGNLVMSWLHVEGTKDEGTVHFAVSRDKGKTFDKAIAIPGTKGAGAAHGECPPKLAYKKDGSLYVLFRINQPTADNMHAGNVYFSISKDGGKTWTPRQSVGTKPNASRGFFDLKSLPDGEVAAIWLEGKDKKDTISVGSSLKFARTLPGKDAFSSEVLVSASVCQCCKTKLYIDGQQKIHVVFRKIFSDGARDMAHATSADGGKSFGTARNINPDKWLINGCPHVGPDMVANGKSLHFVWYTMGGKGGIYTNSTQNGGLSYTPRVPVSTSERASHPQITALPNGTLVTVWDEGFKQDQTFTRKIAVKTLSPLGATNTFFLEGGETLVHPVVTALDNKTIFIAYTSKGDTSQEVIYRVVSVR
jgi:hypothetical protein